MDAHSPSVGTTTPPPQLLRGSDLLLVLLAAFGLLVLALLVAIFGLGIDFQFQGDGPAPVAVGLTMAAVQAAVVALPIYVLVIRRRKLKWSVLGFRPTAAIWYVWAVVLVIGMMPLVALINRLVLIVTGKTAFETQTQFLASDTFSWGYLALSLIVVGVAAPIVEELTFRGLFYRWLRQRWRFWTCVIVSGLVFGAIHLHPGLIPATALLGMGFAFLVEKSGSLWPAIVAHGVHNSLNIGLVYLARAFDWPIH